MVKLNSWEIAIIGIFSALHFAVASLNIFFEIFAHVTTDAILCTAILLVAMFTTQRPGVASLIGFTTGLLFFIFGNPIVSIPSWLTRGVVLDLIIFGLMRHKACCIKCTGISAPISFFTSTMLGFGLSTLFFAGSRPFFFSLTFFVLVTLLGSGVSVIGGYLALKIDSRVAPIIRSRIGEKSVTQT